MGKGLFKSPCLVFVEFYYFTGNSFDRITIAIINLVYNLLCILLSGEVWSPLLPWLYIPVTTLYVFTVSISILKIGATDDDTR